MKNLLFLFVFSIVSLTFSTTIFGPVQYERTTGPPNVYDTSFVAYDTTVACTLFVINGDEHGNHRLSAASIEFNGDEIISESDFNQHIGTIIRVISLSAENSFHLRLRSTPGAFLTLSVLRPCDAFVSLSVDTVIGDSACFSASAGGWGELNYSWDFDGDGTFDTVTTTPEICNVYEEADTYWVIVQVEDEVGCVERDSEEVVMEKVNIEINELWTKTFPTPFDTVWPIINPASQISNDGLIILSFWNKFPWFPGGSYIFDWQGEEIYRDSAMNAGGVISPDGKHAVLMEYLPIPDSLRGKEMTIIPHSQWHFYKIMDDTLYQISEWISTSVNNQPIIINEPLRVISHDIFSKWKRGIESDEEFAWGTVTIYDTTGTKLSKLILMNGDGFEVLYPNDFSYLIVYGTKDIIKISWSGDTIWTIAKPGGGGRAVITESGGLVYAAPSYEFQWNMVTSSGRTFVHYYVRAYNSSMEMLFDSTFINLANAKPSLSGNYVICMASDSNEMILLNSFDGTVVWDISLPDDKKVENFEPFLINGDDYFVITTYDGGTNLFIYDKMGTIMSQYSIPFDGSRTNSEILFSQNGKFLLIIRNPEYHFFQLY